MVISVDETNNNACLSCLMLSWLISSVIEYEYREHLIAIVNALFSGYNEQPE
jgi:hypothetical protein